MPKEEELSLDELLSVLGNPIRREILSRVAKETHYPLQLARELGVSQQAIMKHLAVLSRYRLVRCSETRSTTLGPPRKCYISTGQFSIRIDFGPSAFETRLLPVKERPGRAGGPEAGEEKLQSDFQSALELPEAGHRLKAYTELVSGINREVEELEERRQALTALKQEVLREASLEISRMSEDYNERRLLYLLTEHPGTPMDEMARLLHVQREALLRMYREFFDEEI